MRQAAEAHACYQRNQGLFRPESYLVRKLLDRIRTDTQQQQGTAIHHTLVFSHHLAKPQPCEPLGTLLVARGSSIFPVNPLRRIPITTFSVSAPTPSTPMFSNVLAPVA
jgi:hypothetical protein